MGFTRRKTVRAVAIALAVCASLAIAGRLLLTSLAPDPYGVPDAPRHVFIDGGAHRGESIRSFKRTRMYRDHRWHIIAFECNPDLAARLPAAHDIAILNQAMWTNIGSLEFFLTDETTCSSVFKEASMGKLEKRRVDVPSIDFASWLRDNTRQEEFVILKLDVEGAEYPILDHLLAQDAARHIDILFIEFHNAWVGVPKERDEALLRQLRGRGIRVEFAQSQRDGDWFARPRLARKFGK